MFQCSGFALRTGGRGLGARVRYVNILYDFVRHFPFQAIRCDLSLTKMSRIAAPDPF